MTDADHQKPSGEDTTANQPPPPVEPPRPVANQTVLYAAVVAVIGILAGVVIATVSLRQIRTTPPPIAAPQFVVSKELKDLGLAEASDFGIKGNLTTNGLTGRHTTLRSNPAMQRWPQDLRSL